MAEVYRSFNYLPSRASFAKDYLTLPALTRARAPAVSAHARACPALSDVPARPVLPPPRARAPDGVVSCALPDPLRLPLPRTVPAMSYSSSRTPFLRRVFVVGVGMTKVNGAADPLQRAVCSALSRRGREGPRGDRAWGQVGAAAVCRSVLTIGTACGTSTARSQLLGPGGIRVATWVNCGVGD